MPYTARNSTVQRCDKLIAMHRFEITAQSEEAAESAAADISLNSPRWTLVSRDYNIIEIESVEETEQ